MADVMENASPVQKDNKRRRGRKRKAKEMRDQKNADDKDKQPRPDYRPIVKENQNLETFYRKQSFLEENEFDAFMAGLRETLPASFRINTFNQGQASFLRGLIQGPDFASFLESQPLSEDSANLTANRPALETLLWYPDRLGWQMNISRVDLKKNPTLQKFHKFLMAETDNGFISRQEAVSMIPPLVLDVHRGQDIMDMCAAPGSKTAQLLEYLKANAAPTGEKLNRHMFDDGMVVANDVDNKRCYMLVHQSSRLNSPNCIIINQDAARLPNMKVFADDKSQELVDIKFDRVLCDVPCSGDGTIRKNPDVWKKWTVGNANNFHGVQSKILKRGIELLRENGLLVYSTCSMNPIEDEAVIANILRMSGGKVALEEIAHRLPGLKFKPGVSEWIVMNNQMQLIDSPNQVPAENASQIYPSLFSPSNEEKEKFNLNRCIRVLPHLQNTGGFFVAVLKKLSPVMPWEETVPREGAKPVPEQAPVIQDKAPAQPNPKKRRFAGFKEDPFIFMDENDPDWDNLKNGYGLSSEFPVNQLIHRCTSGKKRSIYLVSKKTRDFILANREEEGRTNFVKIINGGMRLFSRADTEAGFRICQDGVNEVLPYIKEEIKVPITKEDLIALLKTRAVRTDDVSSGKQIRESIKPGSFIMIYRYESEEKESVILPLVAWRGEYTVALYVANTYRVHLYALAGLGIGDDGVSNADTQKP